MRHAAGVFAVVLAAAVLSTPLAADDAMEQGRALFNGGATPPCALCHVLADAGSAGTVGPNLDELAPDEARIKNAIAGGIGVMPAYGDLLPADDIAALAAYVSAAVSK